MSTTRAPRRRSPRSDTTCTCSARIATPSDCRSSTPRATGTRVPWACASWRVATAREAARASRRARGRCTVYRPDIGDLLPVYVADPYEGIRARTFAQCSDARDRSATSTPTWRPSASSQRWSRREIALANHLVMGPVILARALRGRGALRGQDPRQRAGVHRQAPARALCGLRARGARGRGRRAGGLPAHRAEPVGGARRRVARCADASRPARRRRRAVRPARSPGGRQSLGTLSVACAARSRAAPAARAARRRAGRPAGGERVRPRRAGGGAARCSGSTASATASSRSSAS